MDANQFQRWEDVQRQQLQLQRQQLAALNRIAVALEQIAQGNPNAPRPPKFIRAIQQFPQFDWASIGAAALNSDRHGATVVRYEGKEYRRRAKDEDIWYNRQIAQVEGPDGRAKPVYEVLIRFSARAAKAKGIPEEIQDLYR